MGFRPRAGHVGEVGEEHVPFLLHRLLRVQPRWWSRLMVRPGQGCLCPRQRWLGAKDILVLAAMYCRYDCCGSLRFDHPDWYAHHEHDLVHVHGPSSYGGPLHR